MPKKTYKKANTRNSQAPDRATAKKGRKDPLRLDLPTGQADEEAIRSFMHDCLVPILAKEFMRKRGKVQE